MSEISAGSDHAGSPACSEVAMNSAVPTSRMTSPSAHASSSTSVGSSTSLMPLVQASIASDKESSRCERTSVSEVSQPATEPHSNAVTESAKRSALTRLAAGRPSAGSAPMCARPPITIPRKDAPITMPKGSSALTARSGVPGVGSSAPGASASSSRASSAAASPSSAAAARASAARIGPKSLPEAALSTTKASTESGKKRKRNVCRKPIKGSACVQPICW
mmetsp:Transcript_1616/g.3696  ORF Transcript_1616/g.3696 Transcript_1616/m.3696 type:complete len:221 (+) Transcript_1616:782-1444(+)